MAAGERHDALRRFSDAIWQRHSLRRQRPSYREIWPTRRDFKEHWPLLAPDLIEADWMVDGARTDSPFTTIAYAVLDPPDRAHQDWRELYDAELQAHSGIAWDLAQENPLARIFRRAKLSPLEADAFRLHAAGDSVPAIARTLGRQQQTVDTVLARAKSKLRDLVMPASEVPLECVL